MLAQSLRIEAIANDGLIVPGQPLSVTVTSATAAPPSCRCAASRSSGSTDSPGARRRPSRRASPFSCAATASVPANAPLTGPYWQRPEDAGRATFAPDAPFGLPFRPTPFKVRLEMGIGGIAVNREVPVQFRYEGAGLVGEKRMELNVVPAFAVSVSPQIVVVPLRRPDAGANAAANCE